MVEMEVSQNRSLRHCLAPTGLQDLGIWSDLGNKDLARPMNEVEFRRSLTRI